MKPTKQPAPPLPPKSQIKSRLKQAQKLLSIHQIDLLVISNRFNIAYLTNLHQIHPTNREALLFITDTSALLYHSSFLIPDPPDSIRTQTMRSDIKLSKLIQSLLPSPTRIGIESHDLTVAEQLKIQSSIPQAIITPLPYPLETLRRSKDVYELKFVQKAISITKQVMSHTIAQLPQYINTTEKQLATQIHYHLLKSGADDLAFPVLVAFDEHSASPHHVATDKPLTKDSIVLLDMGAKYAGYNADMTRTVCLNQSNPEFQQIQNIVLEAYQQGEERLRQIDSTPTTAADIDDAVRNHIKKAGFAKEFVHTTGHALGLEIHEQPSLYFTSHTKITSNMCLTIEPGIYLPNRFGVRHENTLIT